MIVRCKKHRNTPLPIPTTKNPSFFETIRYTHYQRIIYSKKEVPFIPKDEVLFTPQKSNQIFLGFLQV